MTPRLVDTPVLETERLTLRAVGPQDIQAGVTYLQGPRPLYIGGPFSKAHAWNQYAAEIGHWALRGHGLFVICLKGTDAAIGDCGLLCPAGYPEPELGWAIWSAEHEGKGLVREAAEAVRAHAYGDHGWSTLVSYIDPRNSRSIALAKRLGCRLDTDAAIPDLPDWVCTEVYRHPGPGDLQ